MRAPELRLYCFIDALGWKLAEQHGFLQDLLVTRAPLGTLLGYSSTCDPSILTGKLPREQLLALAESVYKQAEDDIQPSPGAKKPAS